MRNCGRRDDRLFLIRNLFSAQERRAVVDTKAQVWIGKRLMASWTTLHYRFHFLIVTSSRLLTQATRQESHPVKYEDQHHQDQVESAGHNPADGHPLPGVLGRIILNLHEGNDTQRNRDRPRQ